MAEKLVCPICGEPTRVYMGNARKDRLCAKHADELKAGTLIRNEDGTYSGKSITAAAPPKPEQENTQPKKIIIDSNNKSKCITCGLDTDGLLFCGRCYGKYKNKSLLFMINNCREVELLDEEYEGFIKCKDGHIVKSKSEKIIDDYLFEHNIRHCYEKPWPYGNSKKEVLHPDFCLLDYLGPGKHVYIEHWGYDDNNRDYTKTKKFKMEKYRASGKITLVSTCEKDQNDFESRLDQILDKDYIIEGTVRDVE